MNQVREPPTTAASPSSNDQGASAMQQDNEDEGAAAAKAAEDRLEASLLALDCLSALASSRLGSRYGFFLFCCICVHR